MNIRQLLDDRITAALHTLGAPDTVTAIVKPSARPEFGDYQANGVMAAAKQLKTNPRELATRLLETLDLSDLADKLEVAGPGFINIHLKNTWLSEVLGGGRMQYAPTEDGRGVLHTPSSQTIVVDYSGPNLAKEMHVGHLRSTIIGDAVARVLEFQGHTVIRQNHVGDWGTQFGMLIAHMVSIAGQNGGVSSVEPQLADLETFYREAKRRFDAEPAFADAARNYVVKLQAGDAECHVLWQQFIDISLHHCEEVYERLGVSLTRADVMPESAYNADLPNIVSDLQEQGLLVEDQGAQCAFLDEFKNKDGSITPIIVQKTGGGYLYATTDLAALRYRSGVLNIDRALYFTDARQALHFQQVFLLARKAGFVREGVSLEHMPFGNMLGEDGKPFKTRTGGTVKLVDLLVEAEERAFTLVTDKNPELADAERHEIARTVGIGAVKYADLSKNRNSDYIFNWETMLSFEGNTAPYLQYAYARIKSIFRRAGVDAEVISSSISLHEVAERALAMKLLQFTEATDSVAKEGLPNHLCTYLYELAGNFMSFYEACPILKEGVAEEVRASRLHLANLTAQTLQTGLGLLGIGVLERM
ncbi:arginyl-tRNA synthetase [Thiothrix caldifontis]|uniref:Arginine--tRNA ligase n=1 Tax=Thiothrix caldifontis TaxID=525918 RepID=A0A1H3VJI6_9GAMM|nr:arginine--tRNA ligase [Thiothrix caldifontis]SDZ74841.1 arginyl-tRNA synthetase [Thiothrix caldifontis]